MIRFDTIQEKIDGGYKLTAYCHSSRCNHNAELDLLKLRDRFGPDFVANHDNLTPRLKCSRCGSKELGLIVSPPSQTNNLNPYLAKKQGR